MRGERHEVAGRVEDVKRAAGLGCQGIPGASWERRPTGIWSRDQRTRERSGLEKAAPETSQEEEARLLRDKRRELSVTHLWAGCDLQTAEI